MIRWLAVLGVVFGGARPAGAIASSCRSDGWGMASGATLPVHPRITFYADSSQRLAALQSRFVAKIDGKVVPAKLSFTPARPFTIVTIEIDSERTGQLEVAWHAKPDDALYLENPTATFTIAKQALPSALHGTTSRYHRAYEHSTVHESWDGLAVKLDATVIAFTVRWRPDPSFLWNTLIVPGSTLEDSNVLHLGEISCVANFDVPTLERGIDLELTAQLPDGRWLPVGGLPSHVVLARLPAGTPMSRP
jgi:hypothetical protein